MNRPKTLALVALASLLAWCGEAKRGETRHEPGKTYGFLARPQGVKAPTEVSAAGLRAAAAELDLTTFLPAAIPVDGRAIGPADFLFAALEVLETGNVKF